MPYALALSTDVLDEKYDAVVVDEAQDFSDEYWLGVEMLLRDQDEGYLYIFIDENQALYPRQGKLPVEDEPFYLTSNCRNTAPIHEVGYAFYEGEQIDAPDMPGPDVSRTGVDGDEAQAVVLWLGDEVVDEKQWETVYVGATRAKSLLAIVGSQKVLKALRDR